MEPANRSAAACSRRWFVTTLAAGSLAGPSLAESPAKGRLFPSAIERYPDPATEFNVFRLTDPQFTSYLPAPSSRTMTQHGDSLIYATDMTGRFEAFRMDLKTGATRQLTEAEGLDPSTVTFLPGDRSFCYLDGDLLVESNLTNFKSREIYRASAGFTMSGGLFVNGDGQTAVLVERTASLAKAEDGKPEGDEKSEGTEKAVEIEKLARVEKALGIERTAVRYRLQLVHLANGASIMLVESDEEICDSILRPRRASVLYRRGGNLWLSNLDGRQNYRLRVSDGTTLQALWSPDGRSVIYLNRPADPHKLNNLREFSPDTNEDKPISDTTQFVRFGRNADATSWTI